LKVINSMKMKKTKNSAVARSINGSALNKRGSMVTKEVKKEALSHSLEIPAFHHNPNRTLEDFS